MARDRKDRYRSIKIGVIDRDRERERDGDKDRVGRQG